MGGVEVSNLLVASDVIRADRDESTSCRVSSLVSVVFVLEQRRFFVDCGHDEIENWDYIGGVVFELSVETLVVFKKMVAIDVQDIDLGDRDIFELEDVVGLFYVVRVVPSCLDESFNEQS